MDEFHRRETDTPTHDTPQTGRRYDDGSQKGTRNHSREFEVVVLVNSDSVIEEVVSGLDIETLFHFGKGT